MLYWYWPPKKSVKKRTGYAVFPAAVGVLHQQLSIGAEQLLTGVDVIIVGEEHQQWRGVENVDSLAAVGVFHQQLLKMAWGCS